MLGWPGRSVGCSKEEEGGGSRGETTRSDQAGPLKRMKYHLNISGRQWEWRGVQIGPDLHFEMCEEQDGGALGESRETSQEATAVVQAPEDGA